MRKCSVLEGGGGEEFFTSGLDENVVLRGTMFVDRS